MTSFETTRTNSGHSASSAPSHHHEDASAHLNPRTGRPLRNTTPYGGRHANDWLFGSITVHKSVKRGVKKVLHGVHSHH